MEVLIELINKYVRAELVVLIPVLIIINKIIDKSNISNNKIPIITSIIGIILSTIYIFSISSISNWHDILLAIFTSVTQGILLSGGAIWNGIVYKQCKGNKCDSKT